MTWTSKLPTEPGFYFYESETWPLHILSDGCGEFYVYDKSGGVHRLTEARYPNRWCGPVVLPEKPELKKI